MGPSLKEINGVTKKENYKICFLLEWIKLISYLYLTEQVSQLIFNNTDYVLVILGPKREKLKRLLS